MKRTINLVAYASSDDEDSAHEECNLTSTSGRKLPKLSPSVTVAGPVDNPALHQGRVRTSPHVDGQFAAFVYVPVPLKKSSPLRDLLEKSVVFSKEIEPALVCDWLDSPGLHTLHISLTPPIYLRNYQRDELRRAVKSAARAVCPFTASFSTFATFQNDEHTRAFLGVEVGAGHHEFQSLAKAIEPVLKLLHQKVFYAEPRFHSSIAWALLATGPTVQDGVLSPGATPGISAPPIISSFPPRLLSELNSAFGQAMSSKAGVFEVDRVSVKVGKETFAWSLGSEK